MKVYIGRYYNNAKPRKIDIRIDPYDTWSMDHTLAYIIVPMLKQLQATKHGSPFVDDEDVPEYLRSTNAKPKENDWDTDEFHHDRWDWVLNEMIWAFEQHSSNDDHAQFYDHSDADQKRLEQKGTKFDIDEFLKSIKVDHKGLEAHEKRKHQAFKLFGKYYTALWD